MVSGQLSKKMDRRLGTTMDGILFRLALAHTLLANKPKELSLRSHCAVLQATFLPTLPDGALEGDLWKRRVVELEKKLDEVQAKAEAERTELLALRAASSVVESQPPSVPTPAPATTKKKNKKGSNPPTSGPPPPRVLLPSSASSNAILIPHLRALNALASALQTKGSPRPPPSVILATSRRCIEGLGLTLSSSLTAPSPSSTTWPPTPTDAVDAICTCLPSVLDIAIPSILLAFKPSSDPKSPNIHCNPFWHTQGGSSPSETRPPATNEDLSVVIDAVLQPLASFILIPAVQALPMLCQARAQHLLSSASPRPVSNPPIATPLDPSALVPVLTQVLDSLDKLCTDASPQPSLRTQILRDSAQALRDCIVLNTLWQMDKLVETTSLSTSSPPTLASGSTSSSALSVQPRPTQAERIRRLARKDTLYHLCTILSLYLRRPVSLVPRQSTFDLREEIGRTLGPFVRKHLTTRRPDHRFDGPTLDEVEQGMIMTVLEHAWAVGVRMGGEDWEGDNHGPSVGAQRADTNADVDVMMEDGSQTT